MAHHFLSPGLLKIANEIMQWAEEYLMAENAKINRPHGSQVVCPFVEASVRNDHFFMAFHPEVNGMSAQHIEGIMLEHMDDFMEMHPLDLESRLTKALLVV